MYRLARSQKFAMGGSVLGVWGLGPQISKFCIFFQKHLNFRAILIKNSAFTTWHRNRQPNMIQLVALIDYVGSG